MTIITDRDRSILNTLKATKVLSFNQILRHYFPGRKKSVVSRRLSILQKNQLIDKFFVSQDEKIFKVITLHKNFQKQTFDKNKFKFGKSESIHHDLGLAEIRNYFIKNKRISRYMTELEIENEELNSDESFSSLLRISKTLKPDASFYYEKNGQFLPLIIEYERSIQTYERYFERFKFIKSINTLNSCIYVCGSEKIKLKLQKIAFDDLNCNKIGFTLFDNFSSKDELLIDFLNNKVAVI